jgi:hypothetical protein
VAPSDYRLIGLAYAGALVALVAGSVSFIILAWRSFRTGRRRRAFWLAAAPIAAWAGFGLLLLSLHWVFWQRWA